MAIQPLHNEKELLASIVGGGQQSFQIIYDRYKDNIYSYALHLLKSDLLAEEIVQETFLALWKHGRELEKLNNLESFLITIAKNRSLNQLKRIKLETKVSRERSMKWVEGHNETVERIMLNDTRKALNNAIDALPPQQKLVYQLCHLEGLKYEEAAQRLSLSTHTVRSYMKLALSSLRKNLSNHTDIAAIIILFRLL